MNDVDVILHDTAVANKVLLWPHVIIIVIRSWMNPYLTDVSSICHCNNVYRCMCTGACVHTVHGTLLPMCHDIVDNMIDQRNAQLLFRDVGNCVTLDLNKLAITMRQLPSQLVCVYTNQYTHANNSIMSAFLVPDASNF